jgi:putative adenylate-forming enzyme
MLPLADAADQLNAFQPDVLIGPPSLLGFLAASAASGRLHIRPERLISVAEVLEPHDREQIAGAFGAPVEQIYQCTEGLLAVSCAAGSLHIQEDVVALQLEPVPGDPARVMPIVTDLWRTTQPIIRYRLNDVLQIEPRRCACGSDFRVIRAIEGRSDDVCYFEALAGGERPFFPDTIRRMILLADAQILDYQALQRRCGDLHIRLSIPNGAPFEEIAQAVRASVAATVAQYACHPPTVTIEQGILPVPPGTKRRRVQSIRA